MKRVIQDFAFPFGVPVVPIRGMNTFSKINEFLNFFKTKC